MDAPSTSTPGAEVDQELIAELRERRAQLRECLDALEASLAAPRSQADASRWTSRVHIALVELSGDFRDHTTLTEGPGGLHEEITRTAPWLSGPVIKLSEEHVTIREQIDDLLARCEQPDTPTEELRESATTLMGRLIRHRQRGADLVYEATQVDLGGET